MPWRKEKQPTPVFWPGEFHGLYGPWGCKELDTTVQLSLSFTSSKKNAVFLEKRGRLLPPRGSRHLSFGLLLRQWTGVVGTPVAPDKPSRQKNSPLTSLKIELSKRQKKTIGVSEEVEKLEPPEVASGNVKWCRHCTDQFGDSLKG